MKDQLLEMGVRLQALREIKGISEKEIAAKLGKSVEEYLEYEEGKHDFSFSFMLNVATFLGVDVIDLLSGESPALSDCAVVKRGQEFFIKKEGSYDYKHLAYTFKNKKGEPFFVTSMPGEEDDKLHSHVGQEFNFVLSGCMELTVGTVKYILNKGDSAYFNSAIPHGIKVIGNKPVKFLAVVMK